MAQKLARRTRRRKRSAKPSSLARQRTRGCSPRRRHPLPPRSKQHQRQAVRRPRPRPRSLPVLARSLLVEASSRAREERRQKSQSHSPLPVSTTRSISWRPSRLRWTRPALGSVLRVSSNIRRFVISRRLVVDADVRSVRRDVSRRRSRRTRNRRCLGSGRR